MTVISVVLLVRNSLMIVALEVIGIQVSHRLEKGLGAYLAILNSLKLPLVIS